LVRLWTWQTIGFDILENLADARLGHFYSDFPNYRILLGQLSERLGVTAFIWCFVEKEEWLQSSFHKQRVLWELAVPRCAILGFLDTQRWSDLIHSKECHPKLPVDALTRRHFPGHTTALIVSPVSEQWIVTPHSSVR
jgi:hypothetical protein